MPLYIPKNFSFSFLYLLTEKYNDIPLLVLFIYIVRKECIFVAAFMIIYKFCKSFCFRILLWFPAFLYLYAFIRHILELFHNLCVRLLCDKTDKNNAN